jgi:hypothetical protein
LATAKRTFNRIVRKVSNSTKRSLRFSRLSCGLEQELAREFTQSPAVRQGFERGVFILGELRADGFRAQHRHRVLLLMGRGRKIFRVGNS